MADSNFSSRDRSQEQGLQRNSGRDIQYLLRGEEQLLQAISARAPLAEVLHKICDALDSEIGNMMSVIALLNEKQAYIAAGRARPETRVYHLIFIGLPATESFSRPTVSIPLLVHPPWQ